MSKNKWRYDWESWEREKSCIKMRVQHAKRLCKEGYGYDFYELRIALDKIFEFYVDAYGYDEKTKIERETHTINKKFRFLKHAPKHLSVLGEDLFYECWRLDIGFSSYDYPDEEEAEREFQIYVKELDGRFWRLVKGIEKFIEEVEKDLRPFLESKEKTKKEGPTP